MAVRLPIAPPSGLAGTTTGVVCASMLSVSATTVMDVNGHDHSASSLISTSSNRPCVWLPASGPCTTASVAGESRGALAPGYRRSIGVGSVRFSRALAAAGPAWPNASPWRQSAPVAPAPVARTDVATPAAPRAAPAPAPSVDGSPVSPHTGRAVSDSHGAGAAPQSSVREGEFSGARRRDRRRGSPMVYAAVLAGRTCRPIPAAVRRYLWQRDGGRCCYRDSLTGCR